MRVVHPRQTSGSEPAGSQSNASRASSSLPVPTAEEEVEVARAAARDRNRHLWIEFEALQRVVGELARKGAADLSDARELQLIDPRGPNPSIDEQRLRLTTVLLVTIANAHRLGWRRMHADRPPRTTHSVRGILAPIGQAFVRPRDGNHPGPADSPCTLRTPRDTALRHLTAAAARYIARDLAARRLPEFTSAEGYRLARSLAAFGAVDSEVRDLLAEANRARLFPPSYGQPASFSERDSPK